MMSLEQPLDLGKGSRGAFVWNRQARDAAIPVGVVVRHGNGCVVYLRWAHMFTEDEGVERFALVSLRPLELEEPFTCPRCGLTARLVGGRLIDP